MPRSVHTPSTQDQEQKSLFRRSILAPLRLRNFCLLFSGQAFSMLGDTFYAVALPWLILTKGGTAGDLGIVLAAYSIPRTGTLLLGGVLSDRLRPYRLMLLTDIMRALLVGAMGALALWGHPTVLQLSIIAAPLGAFAGLFSPAYFSVVPEVLPDEELQAGNAINASFGELAHLIGPSIAGVIVSQLQAGVALLIDAISFVISVGTLAGIKNGTARTPGRAQSDTAASPSQDGPVVQDAVEDGLAALPSPTAEGTLPPSGQEAQSEASPLTFRHFLLHSRLFRAIFPVLLVANLTSGATMAVALPVFVRNSLALDASAYGILLTALSAGLLLGGFGSSKLGSLAKRGNAIILLWIGQAITIGLIPFAGNIVVACCILLAMGIFNGMSNVTFRTCIQQQFPRHLLGRIMGVLMFTEFSLYPLSVALGGIIINFQGPAVIFLVGGLINLSAVLFGALQPELRNI